MQLPSHIHDTITHLSGTLQRAELQDAVQTLQQNYRQRLGAPLPVMGSHDKQRLAYLTSRLPATYAVCWQVMAHLHPYHDKITTVCDLGAGPGTASIAALDRFKGIQHLTLYDQSLGFTGFIQDALMPYGRPYMLEQASFPFKTVPASRFDLVVLSYALNELPPVDRDTLVQQAWQMTNRFLVVVEPGTPQGYHNIEDARRVLKSMEANMVAPCPHLKVCPLIQADWCHFSCHLPRTAFQRLAKQASLNYEDEKYSYIVVAKEALPVVASGRVIKYPIKSKGHSIVDVCTLEGIKRIIVSKKHGAFYKYARHLKWGDAFNQSQKKDEEA